ncbi:MAG: hypothetical protein CMK08_07225 [Ponticaulis sp.]|nr:hypothetical protein [Ponticaulis sp.]MBN03951.1 hypothetical protein [Ponticaulis sp.]
MGQTGFVNTIHTRKSNKFRTYGNIRGIPPYNGSIPPHLKINILWRPKIAQLDAVDTTLQQHLSPDG